MARENPGPWVFGPGDQWTALSGAPRLLAFSLVDVTRIVAALRADVSPISQEIADRIVEVFPDGP